GDLADLAVERGDRGRVDDRAPRAVLIRLVPGDGGRGQPGDVEGADQVDVDDAAEHLEIMGGCVFAVTPDRPAQAGHAGAVDRDPQRAERLCHFDRGDDL